MFPQKILHRRAETKSYKTKARILVVFTADNFFLKLCKKAAFWIFLVRKSRTRLKVFEKGKNKKMVNVLMQAIKCSGMFLFVLLNANKISTSFRCIVKLASIFRILHLNPEWISRIEKVGLNLTKIRIINKNRIANKVFQICSMSRLEIHKQIYARW